MKKVWGLVGLLICCACNQKLTSSGSFTLGSSDGSSSIPASTSTSTPTPTPTMTPTPSPTPSEGLPSISQVTTNYWGEVGNTSQSVSFTTPAAAGSTIVVFVTEANGGNAGGAVTITDTVGNVYHLIDQEDDIASGNWTTLMSFAAYNITPGTLTITAAFFKNAQQYTNLEWHGVAALEVTGATNLVAHKKNLQGVSGSIPNSITSGALVGNSTPSIVIAISTADQDYNKANGGGCANGCGGPLAGTGYTSIPSSTQNANGTTGLWNTGGVENTSFLPDALLEYQVFSSPGTVSATFTPQDSDEYNTLAVMLSK